MEIAKLRKRMEAHFSARYHSKALAEWLEFVFGSPEKKLEASRDASLQKLKAVRK